MFLRSKLFLSPQYFITCLKISMLKQGPNFCFEISGVFRNKGCRDNESQLYINEYSLDTFLIFIFNSFYLKLLTSQNKFSQHQKLTLRLSVVWDELLHELWRFGFIYLTRNVFQRKTDVPPPTQSHPFNPHQCICTCSYNYQRPWIC